MAQAHEPAYTSQSLDEVMKGPGDLPDDIVVVIDREKSLARYPAYKIYYARKGDEGRPLKAGDLDRLERDAAEGRDTVYGVIKIGKHTGAGPYNNTYLVTSVKAADGYGPLLYDVAIELAGTDGLKPDVDSVSDEAAAVWKYYDTKRPDVESSFLVDDEYEYEEVMPLNHASKGRASDHLAKAYYMVGSSPMSELGDKLVRLDKSSAPSETDRLYEELKILIGNEEDELATFEMQPEFQQKIWDGDERIRPGVKGALMDIVDEFVERLDLDAEIKDIIVTGSLANYNWSKFSDIDLHILIDFKEVNDNEELVKRFFDAVRSNWNRTHDIKVKGHEVELYVQDENEPHVSTGVYSLMNDKWLVKPNKVKPFIDKKTAKKKAADIEREVDKVASVLYDGNHEAALDKAAYLKEKIKKMRQTGLEKAGVFSSENLAFKMLRRSEALSKLHDVYIKAYDQALSLDQ